MPSGPKIILRLRLSRPAPVPDVKVVLLRLCRPGTGCENRPDSGSLPQTDVSESM